MIEISIPSLIIAIQAVRSQAAAELVELEAMDEDDDDVGELAQSFADLEKTLNELLGAYDKARSDGFDLPPSGSLLL